MATAAAQGVSDQRGLAETHRRHEAMHHAGEEPQVVRAARLGRAPVAWEVEREDLDAPGQRRDVVPPRLAEASEPVDEDDGRLSVTLGDVVDGQSRRRPRPAAELQA